MHPIPSHHPDHPRQEPGNLSPAVPDRDHLADHHTAGSDADRDTDRGADCSQNSGAHHKMVAVDGLADMVLADQLEDRESHRWWDMVLRRDGGRNRCYREVVVGAVEDKVSEMEVVHRIDCIVVVVVVVLDGSSWAEVGIDCSSVVGEDRHSCYVLRGRYHCNSLDLTFCEAVSSVFDEITLELW